MIDVIGWELDAALAVFADAGLPLPETCRVLPPHGAPYPEGVWRVVRADTARGRITAAFFPCAREPLPEEDDGECQ